MNYSEKDYPLQKESYEIIGICMEVHFIVFDKIILEVKAQKGIVDEHYKWVINYLGISKCPLGLIANFGDNSLITKRIIL